MIVNAGTFHQIDSLDTYVDEIVAANGGVYSVADGAAHIGVYTAYAAGFLATYFPSTLYHFTSAASAESIVASQTIHAGNGMFGTGVYASSFNSAILARLMGARSTEAVVKFSAAGLKKMPTIIPGAWRIFGDVFLK